MSVIKKETRKVSLSLRILLQGFRTFGGAGAPFRVGVGVLIYFESLPFCKNKPHYNHKTNAGADPGLFLGGGALVSCSTSTPIKHIVFFFFAESQLY